MRVVLAASIAALAALGLVVQRSISIAEPYLGDGLWHRHALWLGIGAAAGIAVALVPMKWWQRAALPAVAVGLAALGATVVGLGPELAGARRWLRIGPLIINVGALFQVAFALALAWVAAKDPVPGIGRRALESAALVTAVLVPVALAFQQPDLVLAAELLVIAVAVLATGRRTWIAAAGLGALVLASPVLLWKLLLHGHQKARILDFLSESPDVFGMGYQRAVTGELLRDGGLTGSGFGSAAADGLARLSNARTDFTLTVLGHEWGAIGIAVALGLWAAIVAACLHIGIRARDRFASRLALACGALFAWQAFVHAGVNLGFLPVVGAPGLPLVSYGGSGTVAAFICAGLAARASARG